VQTGRLRILLPEWTTSEIGVHALFHPNRHMPPRVRLLLDFLVEKFAVAEAATLDF
jgi:DNA-binding transcriptional LysR family regulator